jgi:hypothetical protein
MAESPLLKDLPKDILAALQAASTPLTLDVFADANYQGNSQQLPARNGTYNAADLKVAGGVGTGTISSLRFSRTGKVPGYIHSVQLYAEDGCRGASKAFYDSTDYVGDDFNDRACSIRITLWSE